MSLKVKLAAKSECRRIAKYSLIVLLVLYFTFIFAFPLKTAGFHAEIYMAVRNRGLNATLANVEYASPLGEYCAYFKQPNAETPIVMLGGISK